MVKISNSLARSFAKAVMIQNGNNNASKTMYGTVVQDEGVNYVQIDGSTELTPFSSAMDAVPGNRVSVTINKGKAIIVGNVSAPAQNTENFPEGSVNTACLYGPIDGDTLTIKNINASNIKSGTIDASLITVTNIDADSIKAGAITTEHISTDGLNASVIKTGKLSGDRIDAHTITSDHISTDGLSANVIKTGTLDASQVTVSNLSASVIQTGTLDASKATITNINASNITTGTLDGTKATITNINASNINTGTLNASLIKSGTLDASQATITNINASNITTGKLSGNRIDSHTITSDHISTSGLNASVIESTSLNTAIGNVIDAVVDTAFIRDLVAGDITSLTTSTQNLIIGSGDYGTIEVDGTLIQFKDNTQNHNVYIQLGKDTQGNNSLIIKNQNGATILDSSGVTANAIANELIVNDMLKQKDANYTGISANRLNIDSVVTGINNGTSTINTSKIYFDEGRQTLNTKLSSMTNDISGINNNLSTNYYTKTETPNQVNSIIGSTTITRDGQSVNMLAALNSVIDTAEGHTQTISGTNGLLNRMTTAESKITDSAIINTVASNMRVGGRNLLINTETRQLIPNPSSGNLKPTITYETGKTVDEWGTSDAIRAYGSLADGATSSTFASLRNASGKPNRDAIVGVPYVHSIFIKNNHNTNQLNITCNGLTAVGRNIHIYNSGDGEESDIVDSTSNTYVVPAGQIIKFVARSIGSLTAQNAVRGLQFSFGAKNTSTKEFDFTYWHPQIEIGDIATEWQPAPADNASKTMVEQLSDRISLVVDGTSSSSNLVLTQDALTAVANDINLNGRVNFVSTTSNNGGALFTTVINNGRIISTITKNNVTKVIFDSGTYNDNGDPQLRIGSIDIKQQTNESDDTINHISIPGFSSITSDALFMQSTTILGRTWFDVDDYDYIYINELPALSPHIANITITGLSEYNNFGDHIVLVTNDATSGFQQIRNSTRLPVYTLRSGGIVTGQICTLSCSSITTTYSGGSGPRMYLTIYDAVTGGNQLRQIVLNPSELSKTFIWPSNGEYYQLVYRADQTAASAPYGEEIYFINPSLVIGSKPASSVPAPNIDDIVIDNFKDYKIVKNGDASLRNVNIEQLLMNDFYDGGIHFINGLYDMTTTRHLGWDNSTHHNLIPTIATLGFWNGRYSSSSSNLAYCNKGAFGTMATKNTVTAIITGFYQYNLNAFNLGPHTSTTIGSFSVPAGKYILKVSIRTAGNTAIRGIVGITTDDTVAATDISRGYRDDFCVTADGSDYAATGSIVVFVNQASETTWYIKAKANAASNIYPHYAYQSLTPTIGYT